MKRSLRREGIAQVSAAGTREPSTCWDGPPLGHASGAALLPHAVHLVGLDMGKTVFHLVALDAQGKVVIKKRFSRTQRLQYAADLAAQVIVMETCSGAHSPP